MKNYTTIIISVLTLFVFISTISAQEEEKTKLPVGHYSLMFQFGSNLNFTSFEGSAISLKRIVSKNAAIRIGFSPAYANTDSDEINSTDQTKTKDNTITANQYGMSLNALYLFYNEGYKDVFFYFGSGPELSYFTGKTEQIYNIPDGLNNSKNEEERWGIGLLGVVGTEWFVTENISISGEYSIKLNYSHSSQSTTNPPSTFKREISNSSLNLTGNGVKIGLSMYF